MQMYKLIIRPLLFLFDPEVVHHFSFNAIRCVSRLGLGGIIRRLYTINDKRLEREVFGITFKNPVGLAAGFDKNARLYNELSDFGFGFIEIGTLTPKPQEGNPKKRLFRLKADKAIINRMGFNNQGVFDAVTQLKKKHKVIIGGNIGKNNFVVNVSSPNTPGLRALQDKEPLTALLKDLKIENAKCASITTEAKEKPILLKIAPDLTDEQLLDIVAIITETKIDGVIATNTTIVRTGLQSDEDLIHQNGGLSGKPLTDRSTEVIRFLAEKSNNSFPIIGVGGIHSAQDALDKLQAGASLVQLWTGFVYEGPALIKKINKALLK